jgi:hypothetical protein
MYPCTTDVLILEAPVLEILTGLLPETDQLVPDRPVCPLEEKVSD